MAFGEPAHHRRSRSKPPSSWTCRASSACTGVPKTIVNDTIEIMGALPERNVRPTACNCPMKSRKHRSRPKKGTRRERWCQWSIRASAVFCMVVSGCRRPARQGKKVYISVDMEGISGVNGDDQTSAGQPEYGRARKLMAEDANAAIRGAFDGGATDVSSTIRTAASATCCPRISIHARASSATASSATA